VSRSRGGGRGRRRKVLEFEGELTIHTAADRKTALMTLTEAGGDLDVDLSAVTEMDTAGLQLLLLAAREAAAHGGRLRVVGGSRAVADVLAIAHLDERLVHKHEVAEVAR
jgi:anti-sigma B factor antagonist